MRLAYVGRETLVPTCARCTAHHDAELNTLLDILLAPDLDLYEYVNPRLSGRVLTIKRKLRRGK